MLGTGKKKTGPLLGTWKLNREIRHMYDGRYETDIFKSQKKNHFTFKWKCGHAWADVGTSMKAQDTMRSMGNERVPDRYADRGR